MNIKNKNIIVIGNGKSGMSASILANQEGANVTIYDQVPFSKLTKSKQKKLKSLQNKNIKLLFETNLIDCIHKYDLIIKSPGVPMELDFLKRAKKISISIIGEFEFASQYSLANICAITGTNGKTTTTALIGMVAKTYNSNSYIVGNIGNAFSNEVSKIQKNDFVIAETSSFQLESITKFHPNISCVLNIEEDHLNRHVTMENYIDMKKRVFKNQTNKDYTVLNYDDLICRKMKNDTRANVIWFSRKKELSNGIFIKNNNIIEKINNKENIICNTKDLKILGNHNIENALAAVTILTLLKVPKKIISQQIVKFQAVAHRIEYIGSKNNVDFYNDSKATNPDAAIKGLTSMAKPVRLIIGGLDKKSNFDKWISLFPKRVIGVYIIGETKPQIIKTLKKYKFTNFETFDTLKAATTKSYLDSKPGECILLSPGCASWDMFDSFEQRGEIFKEIFQHLKE